MRSFRVLHVSQGLSDIALEDPTTLLTGSQKEPSGILVVSRAESCTIFGPLGVISGIIDFWSCCGRGPVANASRDGSQLLVEGSFEEIEGELRSALKFACGSEIVSIEKQTAFA